MEENRQHFQNIRLYYFTEGKNATETPRKVCAVCGEGAVTDRVCQSGSRSFVLEISRWTMLHSWVDKWKLIAIKSRQ